MTLINNILNFKFIIIYTINNKQILLSIKKQKNIK